MRYVGLKHFPFLLRGGTVAVDAYGTIAVYPRT
jgi:hypothetical protein